MAASAQERREARRRQVAAIYGDSRLPVSERSSRALARRFDVSHRTILNDLAALGIEERLSKPPPGGIPRARRQAIVREMYPSRTCDEIAATLGCSGQTVKRDVHELGLEPRKPAPRRRHSEPEPRPCECCGEPFTPTAGQVAKGYGRFKNRDHYDGWRRERLEAVGKETQPLYEQGLSLDQIREQRPDLTRDEIWRGLRAVGVTMRPAHRRMGLRMAGRYVKCRARDYDFCPHGDQERWVPHSQGTEFLSRACRSRYRAKEEWRTLLPLAEANIDRWPGKARQRWAGRMNANKPPATGAMPRGRPQTTLPPEQVEKIQRLHAKLGRAAIAKRLGVSERQVRRVLKALTE